MPEQQVDVTPEQLTKPVGSLEQAIPLLRRPFTPEAVHWKVQASFRRNESALIVPYIDVRLAADRLDLVCGANWQEGDVANGIPPFQEVPGGLLCCLVVFGVPRFDLGSGYQGKGLYSDAFKRTGVKFGIGRSLYAFPKTTLDVDEHKLLDKRTVKSRQGGKTVNVLLPNGEAHMRGVYKLWLEQVGVKAFGRPLDHGDQGGALGDVEAEGAAGADNVEDEEESPETKEGKAALQQAIKDRKAATPSEGSGS